MNEPKLDLFKHVESLKEWVKNGGGELDPLQKAIVEMVKELEEAKEEVKFLDALEAAGVDNWVGYEEAKEALNG